MLMLKAPSEKNLTRYAKEKRSVSSRMMVSSLDIKRMAKTSAVQRNLKRIRLSKKYFKKRMELKKIINNKKLPLSDRFAAQLKLNKLPVEVDVIPPVSE